MTEIDLKALKIVNQGRFWQNKRLNPDKMVLIFIQVQIQGSLQGLFLNFQVERNRSNMQQ